jgi:hypothetical protein
MKKNNAAARAARKTREISAWHLARLGPRTRLRFSHPKGCVTIVENEGPGFIKVNDAVVFADEYVRVHDTTRVSTITTYEMPAFLQITTRKRTDRTPPPRKVVSLTEVEVPST